MKSTHRKPQLEILEKRRVMAAPAPLTIEGTLGSDTIEVYAVQDSVTEVMVKVNGNVSGPFFPVGPIRIQGLAGADTIRVAADVYLPTEIDGGAGVDSLDGGSGDDVFLVRDHEKDIVRGGLGMDQAAADSSDEPTQIEIINPASPGSAVEPLHIKILVVNYDPIVPEEGNRRLYEIFGWSNPRDLADGYKADVERASGGAVLFEIVEWRDVNEIPVFDNGFQYTPNAYVQTRRANSGFNQGRADFALMVEDQGIVPLIDSGTIDEVWFFGDHFFHLPGESWMAGPGAFFINGPVYDQIPTTRPFASMGFSYERGVAEMIHNLGHRTEATMNRVYGGWDLANPTSNWDRFSANVAESNGLAGVGTTHFPANAESGYDTFNPRTVQSWADDYLSYPNLTFQTRPVNRGSWAKGLNPDYERSYQNWYFSRLPRAVGANVDGKLNNWWQYVYAFEHYTSTGQPFPIEVTANADPVLINGKPHHYFNVQYSGASGIRTSSLGDGDVYVVGPNGFEAVAEFVMSSGSAGTDQHLVATYRVAAPGGAWDTAAFGSYEILLKSNEIIDGRGVPISPRSIGEFQVRQLGPAELPNDESTSLLLRLDGSLAGADGETTSNALQPNYLSGLLGQGAMFLGGDHALYPKLGNINPQAGTIEFLIQPNWNADGTSRTFVEIGDRFNNGMLISIDGANNLRFIQWGDNPQTPVIESFYERGVGIDARHWVRDQWYHVAVTWDQSTQRIAYYLDGQLRKVTAGVNFADFENTHIVIGSSYGGFESSDAVFDELRISTRARTPSEIAANYLSSFGLIELYVDSVATGVVGQKNQARAFGRFGIESDFDATEQVLWTSSNPSVATISSSGEVEFRGPGSVEITASLGAMSDSVQIDVSQSFAPVVESVEFNVFNQTFAQSEQLFTVRFSKMNPPLEASLGRGDFVVRGPAGFFQFPVLVEAIPDSATGQMLATYRFIPPGGYWDSRDNGDYLLDVVGQQMADSQGDFAIGKVRLATLGLQIGGSSAPIVASANAAVSETVSDQTLVWRMSASDPTTGQPASVTWNIVAGNDDSVFQIHADTGHVLIANSSQIDFYRKRDYALLVQATDRQDSAQRGQGILRVRINGRFHNADNPFDVDANGSANPSPLDVLSIVNYINLGASSVPPPNVSSPPYWDADNDGYISPLDVLFVVNQINRNSGGGGGEGETADGRDAWGLGEIYGEPDAFWLDDMCDQDLDVIYGSRRRRR